MESLAQQPMTPDTQAPPRRPLDARTARLTALGQHAAATQYRMEQEFLGIETERVEPFSSLPALTQQRYIDRVSICVAGGIGHLFNGAEAVAIRKISVEHDVRTEYRPEAAQDIEAMLGDVNAYTEAELLKQWKARTR